MSALKIHTSAEFERTFNNYPVDVKPKLIELRKLIIETAKSIKDITVIEETLKWNEPSFISKIGSTIRIDCKEQSPNQYAMYFQCTSRLVETFRSLFKNALQFEGKRAIVFQINTELPKEELRYCIISALRYHKVKHLPTLGI